MARNNENKINKGSRFGVRHIIFLHTFILMAVAIGMRITLSVTIVAMTDNTTSSNPDIPTYNWTNKSVILSSFFWGYIMLQVLAGLLVKKYGTKDILVVAMLVNTIAFSLIPLMADKIGSYGVILCRVVQGLSQGFFFTSCYTLLGNWAPVEERSLMVAFVLAGSPFGSVITTPLVGYICSTSIGWPPVFYIYGGLGILWIISWYIFGASSPATHKSISKEEKNYIEGSVGTLTKVKQQKHVTPWRDMLTSLPVYAIVITTFGQSYGYATLMAEMPNYMNKVMKFNITSNGLLSSLPYLSAFILGPIFGSCSDYLINGKYLGVRTTRKIFTTISAVIPAFALLVLSYLPDDATTLSVFMLITAVGGNSAMSGGYFSNHMDLSPRFSGIIMAFSNSCATICAILAPLVVQFVVTDETDKSLWRIVFIISVALFISTEIFYLLFAAGELQSWNGEEDSQSIKIEEANMKIRKISTVI